MPGGFWKLMLCFDSVIFLIPESIMWVSLGLHHDFSSVLHTVNYFFSSGFYLIFLPLSLTHTHRTTSLCNIVFDRCSPKLFFPPFRGQVDQPPVEKARERVQWSGDNDFYFLLGKKWMKSSRLWKSLERKINYGNEERSHYNHTRGQKFV